MKALLLLVAIFLLFHSLFAEVDKDDAAESGMGSGSSESGDAESGSESGDSEDLNKRSSIAFNGDNMNFYQRSMPERRTRRSTNVTYPDIINKTLEAITDEETTAKELRELFFTYFCTDNKDLSIWPKAVTETEEMLGLEFSERELFECENDVKSICRRFLECELHEKNQKKKKAKPKVIARCFLSLVEYIDDGFTDFALPRGSVEGQAHMFQMHMSYQLMSLLLLKYAEKVAKAAGVSYMRAASSVVEISENLVNQTKIVTKNTIDARLQAISQIEICLMQEVLWQEFQVSCEFRIKKRSLDAGAGIGGEKDIFKRRYRAKVVDYVTQEEICNKAMTTSENMDDDEVKEKLTKICTVKRDLHAKQKHEEITAFYASRSLPVAQNVCKLWSCNDQKLSKMKANLNTKYLI